MRERTIQGGTRVRGVVRLLAIVAFSVPSFSQPAAKIGSEPGELLLQAVRNQDEAAARALLKQGVDVNVTRGDGSTALHWAAHRDHETMVDLLIGAGAAVNAADDHGTTPLWLACQNRSVAVVERLLDAGADPNAALSSGETPLMTASRTGSPAVVKLLLAHGADVNSREGSRGQTALMWAAAQRHPEVVQVLLDAGADIHARSNIWHQLVNTSGNTDARGVINMAHGGSTPLLFATRANSIETLRVLVAAGADVNDTAPAGTSALVLAVLSGHTETATFLLDQGADLHAAEAGYTAFHAAVLRADMELIETLLARGADHNAVVTRGSPGRRFSLDYYLDYDWIGMTPFWLAARFAEIDIMRLLLARGTDPLIISRDGTTVLMEAMGVLGDVDRRGRRTVSPWGPGEEERVTLEVARLLVELGVDVNAVSKAGNTALHGAAGKGFNSVVQFLVEKGAILDVKNKKEETPLTLAEEKRRAPRRAPRKNGEESTADLLRRLGAKE